MNRKQALTPSEGIYYVVPQKVGNPMVVSQRSSDHTEDVTHLFFWEKVLRLLAKEFNLSHGDIEDLRTMYMSIPRGRVQKVLGDDFKPTGGYVVVHGNDVPLSMVKPFVHQDFGLIQLAAEGKVIWKEEAHEKMDKQDRTVLQDILKSKRG